ncbi:MAG TPA: medium chain dehydrogenase/reductase family protein [Kofleriaceae bacterium]|nr:medium chain dehydrogenase/reductase family protein [Kofleriaceae bacterium]
MKVVIHAPGGYEQLKLMPAAAPAPQAAEVRIDVRAIGVNYADTTVRMGLYSSARQYVGWPITPGFEVSGVVGAVGPDVRDLAAGDPVIAVTRFGGYSSEVVAPRRQVWRKPAATSFEQAAALPAVYMTAWYALHELAHPRRGAKVLVHSAAGGVGGALIQLAKLRGCEVVGVVGASAKVASAQGLGADHVIDKSAQDLWREARRLAPEGYDVILDANGVSTLAGSYAHLRRTGKLVVYGFHSMLPKTGGKPRWTKLALDWLRTPRFSPLEMTESSKSVMAFNLSYLFDRDDLMQEGVGELLRWVEDRSIVPPPVTTYPLAEVARAHADLESGRTVGKLVLLP